MKTLNDEKRLGNKQQFNDPFKEAKRKKAGRAATPESPICGPWSLIVLFFPKPLFIKILETISLGDRRLSPQSYKTAGFNDQLHFGHQQQQQAQPNAACFSLVQQINNCATNQTAASTNNASNLRFLPSQTKWVPPVQVNKAGLDQEERRQVIVKKVKGILNKITPEKFDKLSIDILNVGIESKQILKDIAHLVLEKACNEVKFSGLYADLCLRLCCDAPDFESPPLSSAAASVNSGRPASRQQQPAAGSIGAAAASSFGLLLLAYCENRFEGRHNVLAGLAPLVVNNAGNGSVGDAAAGGDIDEQRRQQLEEATSRRLSALVGLFRFIGELSLRGLVPEPVLHRCIRKLLASKSGPNLPMDMECLCTLLLITGRRFDTGPAVNLFDQYFARVGKIMSTTASATAAAAAGGGGLPLRVRFMLDDLLELRRNAWVPRRLGQQVDADRPRMMDEWRDGAGGITGVGSGGGIAVNGGGANSNGGHSSAPLLLTASNASKERHLMQQPPPPQHPPPLMKDEPSAWRRPHQPALIAAAAASSDVAMPSSSGGAEPKVPPSASATNGNGNAAPFGPKLQSLGRLQQLPQMSARSQQQQQQQQQHKQQLQHQQHQGGGTILAPQGHHRWQQPTGPPPQLQQQRRNDMPLLAKPKQATFTFEPAYFRQVTAKGHNYGRGQQHQSTAKKEEPESPQVIAARDIESLGTRLWSGDHAWVRDQLNRLTWPTERPELLVHRLLVAGIEAEPSSVVSLLEYLGETPHIADVKQHQQARALCPAGSVLSGLRQYCDHSMASLESTGVPLVRSRSAKIVAQLVLQNQVSLADCFSVLRGGRHHPLGLLLLQQLIAQRSADWIRARLSEAGLQMTELLPEGADLLAAVEERGLTGLVPKLKLLEDLRRGRVGSAPDQVAAFLANADEELLRKPEFVHALVHHVYSAVETDPGSAEHTDKEKLQLEKTRLGPYAQLLANLDGLELLNGLLVHWVRAGNPPAALLRAFMTVYDLEVCDEETIVRWKEEVNHAYPDKGKALFQLNKFLNWLEQAEEESDEDGAVAK